jgi:ABC-2 type transport system ATP-binding protein
VEQVCERVAILKEGRLIRQGSVAELLRRGQGIRLRVAGDPAPALALLRELGWVGAVAQQDGLLLVDAPGERAAELNAYLAGRGVPVAEIGARESSLEEFFLEVTR